MARTRKRAVTRRKRAFGRKSSGKRVLRARASRVSGRGASGKSKNSKVRKLIALARRGRSSKKKRR